MGGLFCHDTLMANDADEVGLLFKRESHTRAQRSKCVNRAS